VNCQQANALAIVGYLASAGFTPEKSTDGHAWYRSPLRDEKTPSFKVDLSRNIWFDHGLGAGGRLVDLVQALHHVDVSGALRLLSGTDAALFSFHPQKVPSTARASALQITRVDRLTHPVLLDYCKGRGIPADVAVAHLEEVHFSVNGSESNQFAVGFRNQSGGYELRNKLLKSCARKKDYTLIRTGNADVVSVFEGFFDYVSALVVSKKAKTSHHVLVLNSLSLLPLALARLSTYRTVHLHLDNDDAGRIATQAILSALPQAVDKSKFYREHKDLNAYLVAVG
jgi:hypothetical protein